VLNKEMENGGRKHLLITLAVVIAIGLGSRLIHTGVHLLDKYLGDALYAVMVYLLVTLSRCGVTPLSRGVLAMAVMTSLELFQLTGIPLAMVNSGNLALKIVGRLLGTAFGWLDLVAYGVGIVAAVAVTIGCSRRNCMTIDKRAMFKIVLIAAITVSFSTLVATATVTASQSATIPATARSSEHIYNLSGLGNVGRVAPGILRGAQPEKDGYATLKAMGIRTVIDLRTSESEKQQVEAAGMKAVAIPIEMSRDGLKEKVDKVVALMADPANQPVYVHCRHGQDRTGIVVAAFRMKQQGWRLADAEAEMQSFGFNDVWVNFKKFIRRYGAELAQK
jgi:tyrosine-protein phosphatase SIW14